MRSAAKLVEQSLGYWYLSKTSNGKYNDRRSFAAPIINPAFGSISVGIACEHTKIIQLERITTKTGCASDRVPVSSVRLTTSVSLRRQLSLQSQCQPEPYQCLK
jgi:hypothetical protein